MRGLWDEFEEARTSEARFVQAMDRLQVVTQNVFGGGGDWRRRGVTEEMNRTRRVEAALEYAPPCRQRSKRSWTARRAKDCGVEAPRFRRTVEPAFEDH